MRTALGSLLGSIKCRSLLLLTGSAALVALPVIFFVIYYVGQEQPVYYWDYYAWFSLYQTYGEKAASGQMSWFFHWLVTVFAANYNSTSIVPLIPFYFLLGETRTAYVLGIVLLYMLPALYLMGRVCVEALGLSKSDKTSLFFVYVSALFFWPVWLSVLRGMPDVVALIPLALAQLCIFKIWKNGAYAPREGVRLGGWLWLPFLLRRWFIFTSFTAASLTTISLAFSMSGAWCRPSQWARVIKFIAALGLTILLCVGVFQGGVAWRILTTSYSQTYEAYAKSWADQALFMYAILGPVLTGLILGGAVRAIMMRRYSLVFMFVCAAVTYLLFNFTQAPDIHHLLPVFFWLFPCVVYAGLELGRFLHARRVLPTLFLALFCSSFLTVFVPGVRGYSAAIWTITPSASFVPLHLDQYENYRQLAADLSELTQTGSFTVFGADPKMTGDIFLSLSPALKGAYVPPGQIDARDGVVHASLRAQFAVVTDKVAAYLGDEYQRVITIPNDLIRHSVGFGQGYTLVKGPYHLDGGIKAYIYKRNRSLSDDDLRDLALRLQQFYPAWRDGRYGLAPKNAEGANGLGIAE